MSTRKTKIPTGEVPLPNKGAEHQNILDEGKDVMRRIFGPEWKAEGEDKLYWDLFYEMSHWDTYHKDIVRFCDVMKIELAKEVERGHQFMAVFKGEIEKQRQRIREGVSSNVVSNKLDNEAWGELLRHFCMSEPIRDIVQRSLHVTIQEPNSRDRAIHVMELIRAERKGLLDGATGLLNKEGWREIGKHQMARAIREMEPLLLQKDEEGKSVSPDRASLEKKSCSILVLDIDFFKQVNDTYGHPMGDHVLKVIANIIDSIRDTDYVFRYGGEEFCVILPDTDLTTALQVAERIRERVAQTDIEVMGYKKPLRKTVSIGVVNLLQLNGWQRVVNLLQEQSPGVDRDQIKTQMESSLLNEAFDAADAALYVSKNTGRNKVTCFEDGMKRKK